MHMQPLSFQVNQVVLVENVDAPYSYELAKVLYRRQNQDQAYQYQIKFYKQKQNSQSIPVGSFKLRKVNLKIFYILKQKCQQFPELAQSFRSVEFQLSKNQAFIDQQQKDKIWKKLFKKTILYLQAKKSARIKQRSAHKQPVKKQNHKSFESMALSKHKLYFNPKAETSQEQKKLQISKCQLLNCVKNKINNAKQPNRNKQKVLKSKSKSKKKNKSQNKLHRVKIEDQSIINQRYKSLFLFGLNYVASQEKMQKTQQYFQQVEDNNPDDCQKESQEVQNYLDQLKVLLFQFHFEDCKNMQVKISALQSPLTIKLKHLLHSRLSILSQNVLEKMILVVKIYYLKQITTMKSIIMTLKIWLKLFIQKMGQKDLKTKYLSKTYSQFKLLVQQVLNLNHFE